MKAYMIRHKPTGEFFRRGGCSTWGPQKKGAVWLSKVGPAAALCAIKTDFRWRRNAADCEVLEYEMILCNPTPSA